MWVILVFFNFLHQNFSSPEFSASELTPSESFLWEFSSSEFSLPESEEITISSIIYLEIFFWLEQQIYILLRTLENNNFYFF